MSTPPRRSRRARRARAPPPLDALLAPRRVRCRHAGARHRARRRAATCGTPPATGCSTVSRACSPCRSVTVAPSSPRRRAPRRRRSSTSRSGRYAHPPAIELAARLAELAPGDLNRVFFTTGGSEAVESAWKLARQYFRAIGQGQRHKVIARAHRVPRHDAGRARDHRRARAAHAVRAAHAGRRPRRQHQPLPPPARRRREGVHARPHRRARGARSSSRGPRPSPRCSSSRCRTPAGASCRPTATSSGCARSATGTACCSCPTR